MTYCDASYDSRIECELEQDHDGEHVSTLSCGSVVIWS
jgi:hypothetical protein